MKRIQRLICILLGLTLIVSTAWAQEEDEDEEYFDESEEETYEPPPEESNRPSDGVRTPPTPRGVNPPPPRPNYTSNGGSSGSFADSENIEFRLVDPPKYYKKKKRPPLPPAQSIN